MMKPTSVYFYPHAYLRARHIDTIRQWPRQQVANPEVAEDRRADAVKADDARAGRVRQSWKQRVPLANAKRRPRDAPREAVIYVWGAVVLTGSYILDLDNPYALVGYNLRAMKVWRPVIQQALESRRCLEIRCMSEACRTSLIELFGARVGEKAAVVYPRIPYGPAPADLEETSNPRFLFVGSQFEIKGGRALLAAFPRVREAIPGASLLMITYLPPDLSGSALPDGVTIQEGTVPREQLMSEVMAHANVLVHPTYVESFGMVVLEALARGLAVVASDVYALPEMVSHGDNGILVHPPISVWDGVRPAELHRSLDRAAAIIRSLDTRRYEQQLVEAMTEIAANPKRLAAAQAASLALFKRRFWS